MEQYYKHPVMRQNTANQFGINLGRLGFLAEAEMSDLDSILIS